MGRKVSGYLAGIVVISMLLLSSGCIRQCKNCVSWEEFEQYQENALKQVRDISAEINQANQVNKKNKEKVEENRKDIEELEKRCGSGGEEYQGTYLVLKADKKLTEGMVEFDVRGLSNSGTTKDVMFVLTNGMTVENYEGYRLDIRKYAGGLDLMKSVFVNGSFAVELYWDNQKKIYWDPTHAYRFLVKWGGGKVTAIRTDLSTAEKKEVVINYSASGKVFSPDYIMVGWNAKYGIPPGGYYFNIKLPPADYTVVKYKP